MIRCDLLFRKATTLKRTTAVLTKDNLIDTEAFRKEISSGKFDYRFLSSAPSGENRLEGYLFPDTYEVFTNASEHDIINKMLSQFDKVFTDKYYARAEELGMSINEVITLASIIEREAATEADRPIIAGVFYNRIAKEMPLQSCATVQYILGDQKAVLSIADTKIESPYNTYLNNGLPPGPDLFTGAGFDQGGPMADKIELFVLPGKGRRFTCICRDLC